MKLKHWIIIIAVLHIGFLIMETFFWRWTSTRLASSFQSGAPGDGAPGWEMVRALLWNQGVYNGFLAAGLIWSVLNWSGTSAPGGPRLAAFFLGCVVIAGFFGYFTVGYATIFLIQALPASAVLMVLLRRGWAPFRPSEHVSGR
jgi:putative membrane protein